jgi:hypothetical protein
MVRAAAAAARDPAEARLRLAAIGEGAQRLGLGFEARLARRMAADLADRS